jgi:hypothetical protein
MSKTASSSISSTFGLFFRPDGTITGAMFWILLGPPLFYSGRWFLGSISVLAGLLLALCHAMNEMTEQDKADIRFNVLEAQDVVQEIKTADASDPILLMSALESLAKKVSKRRKGMYDADSLELSCQEAAYLALQRGTDDDGIVAASISLLALVAKNKAVRNRHLTDATYALDLPLQAMRLSLQRIQQQQDDASEDDELVVAEVQRKSCLWMGALADQDRTLGSLLVDYGGLDCILHALDWFRHHVDVNNWGLWAIFNLCFEHEGNQAELVRNGGLTVLCKSILLNCEDSVEVCRHGLAILFDLLRQPQIDLLATTKALEMRKVAICAGLHDAVRQAMAAHPDSMEIMGMGTEMLISTGYEGDIPLYQPLE